MTSSSYPPGWYDDRSRPGYQRWWDGEAWTTHLRTPLPPGQLSQPPPLPASLLTDPTAAPVAVGGTGWRRPRVLVPALVGLITLIGAAAALSPPSNDQVVAGSETRISDEPSTTIAPSTAVVVTEPPTTAPSTTEAPTTTAAPTTTTRPPTTAAPTTTTRPPTTVAPTTRRATTAAPATSAAIKPLTGACDPNYTGACVPIASDVDCAGGSGNGPAFVRGPVTVVGRDIYGLDGNDNDGIGCESG